MAGRYEQYVRKIISIIYLNIELIVKYTNIPNKINDKYLYN